MFGLSFHPYGLFIGLGILAAFEASVRLSKVRGIDRKLIESLFWWVIICGIFGARLYHVIDKWNTIYSISPKSVLYIWNGGLGIWGAIIGGVVGLLGYWVIKLRRKISFLYLMDVAVIGVPLGQAIGRWGNFFNNEIVGRSGEPLFLYESLLNLLLFGILIIIGRMGRIGLITGTYLVGYGLIRFALEPLRPDIIVWKIAGIPTAMIFSALAIAFGILIILKNRSISHFRV